MLYLPPWPPIGGLSGALLVMLLMYYIALKYRAFRVRKVNVCKTPKLFVLGINT